MGLKNCGETSEIDLITGLVVLDELHNLSPEMISVGHAAGVPVDEALVEELLE